jgi:twitching motility protein PilT
MAAIDALFDLLIDKNGSDLHLAQGQHPKCRVHGELETIDEYPILTEETIISLLKEIADTSKWEKYINCGDCDFAYSMGTKARFRANYLKQAHGLGAVFRVIPSNVLTLEQIDAPVIFQSFATLKSGLVLVTGPTGSGKSTTLAAIIDYINSNYEKKIITIEEPVEFVHQSKRSVIVHREVGADTVSFMSGLQGALKSDVNIVLVGEMRDRETIELALTAAESGVLVFGTLHTNSAGKTIDRVIDTFPAQKKNQIRTQLSNSLKAIVAQQLLRSSDGSRRWAAFEILIYTSALPAVIRAGETGKIASILQTGRQFGMIAMDDYLAGLVQEGKVTMEAAYMKAIDKSRFSGEPGLKK